MDTTIDSCGVDTIIDSCGVDTTVDSCGVDTTVDSCGVDANVDSCGVDAIILLYMLVQLHFKIRTFRGFKMCLGLASCEHFLRM